MRVEVFLVKEDATLRLKRFVSARAARLLHVVFKRRRDVVVHHQSDVFFVHTHAESIGGDDRLDVARDERILIGAFFGRIHASGKGNGF